MGAVTSDRRIEEFLKYCRTSKSLSRHTISAYAQDLNEFSRFRSLFPDGPTLCSFFARTHACWRGSVEISAKQPLLPSRVAVCSKLVGVSWAPLDSGPVPGTARI